MGRRAGFKYRKIVKRLRQLGFEFDRYAAATGWEREAVAFRRIHATWQEKYADEYNEPL